MFTVLIVEDELLVRIGLKSSIDWEKLNMQVIADVSNGQAALDIYEKEKPDIILTDIKMPVMDGIQLISKIREKDRKTKIVVLTCFEEFDTIHKAVNLGVSGYILKLKMSTAEMENILMKIRDELIKENKTVARNSEGDINSNLSKEELIKKYLFYHIYTDDEFANLVAAKKWRFTQGRLLLCRMVIDHFELLQDKFGDDHGALINFAVMNIIEEILQGFGRGEVIHEKDENYLIIMSFKDIVSEIKLNEELHRILGRIRDVMKTYVNTSVTFGISGIHEQYHELREMYRECTDAVEQKYFIGMGNFIRYEPGMAKNNTTGAINKLKHFIGNINLINEEYKKVMSADIAVLAQNTQVSKNELQGVFLKWIYLATTYMSINKEALQKIAVQYAEQVHKCVCLDENMANFEEFLEQTAKIEEQSMCLSKEVAEVVQFVQRNYNREISLQQAAEMVNMSPNYLSSLFKKEFGLSFVEYVNQVRIDKAKELLMNTFQKTYEIARNVGFADESYFSRIFKKLTGIRPNEYRKQWVMVPQEECYGEED